MLAVRRGMLSAAAIGRVVASHAVETGDEPPFGRADAIAQAATIEAARTGARVTPAR